MFGRLAWGLGTALVYAGIVYGGEWITAGHGWFYGGLYLLLGLLLLGSVARFWRGGSAALWRPVMLSVGSLAAAIEVALHSAELGSPAVDRWMIALLGLLAAAILARVVPERTTRAWLGIDRRVHDIGA